MPSKKRDSREIDIDDLIDELDELHRQLEASENEIIALQHELKLQEEDSLNAVQLVYYTWGEFSETRHFTIKYHPLDGSEQITALTARNVWYIGPDKDAENRIPKGLAAFAGFCFPDEHQADGDGDDDTLSASGNWVVQHDPPQGWVVRKMVCVQDYRGEW
jgi:hypothetical protein